MRVAQRTLLGIGCATTVALALGACKAKGTNGATAGDTGAAAANASGDTAAGVQNVAMHPFAGDPQQARRGRYLFVEYNCYGCHGGLAGGAMGPSLRDTVWKYGGTDAALTATIKQGRPMGMPAWGTTLSDAQIKDIIAYIHSLRTTAEPKFFFLEAMKDSLGMGSSTQ